MKRWIAIFLILALVLSGCSPSQKPDQTPDAGQTPHAGQAPDGGDAYLPLTEELEQASQIHMELGREAQALADFAAAMEQMRDQGLEFLSYGMTRQAAWCFSFVGGSVSAVRYAAEELLGTASEGFSGWDTIGAISLCSPVPFLCEAITAQHSGDTARAEECREMVKENPFILSEMDALSILPELSDAGLKELVEGLIAFEHHIYWFYPADPQPAERSGYEWSSEFHLDLAIFFEAMEKQELATRSYLNALTADPFDPEVYAMCALHMYSISNVELMRTYIEEGLLIDPAHGTLNVLAAMFWSGAGELELAQSHLDTAAKAELNEVDMVIYESVAALIKEG